MSLRPYPWTCGHASTGTKNCRSTCWESDHRFHVPFIANGLWHAERHIAQERAAGSCHLDFAGSGARGYGGRDFGIRYYGESCRFAVKVNACRPRQIGTQNLNSSSHLRRSRLGFHKWPQTYRQTEDRAEAVGPAVVRCPVQIPICGLNQPPNRVLSVRATTL